MNAAALPAAGQLIEIGYVVDDIDAAIRFFATRVDAGPFRLFRHLEMRRPRYFGRPTDVDIDVAMGVFGGVVLELVKQHNDAPSPFHRPGNGAIHALNHLSLFVADFDQALARYLERGLEVAFTAEFPGEDGSAVARVAYLDTYATAGAYLEIMERDPPVLASFYASLLDGHVSAAG